MMSDQPLGFVEFLRTAKAATYAAQGDDASVIPALPDSKQLEYRKGSFLYRDIYLGMLRFVGQEVVYCDDLAIWSMSYSGGLNKTVAVDLSSSIYAFLRRALLAPSVLLPVRGPAELNANGMSYACTWEGSLESFHGLEIILKDGQKVYELRFSGGMLA
jgi:Domain of unknown function (DUF5680)